jgi:ubiquinone/menaquinone biosynthesis C-methylase UbiE
VDAVFEQTRPADYLERLAASDLGRGYKDLVRRELAVEPGDVVLDLGCGPGADLPGYAGAGAGQELGIDVDAAALRRCPVRPGIAVQHADVHHLPVAGGSVDGAHTDRVVQHLADPAAVLAETRRVLRPGGRAVFAEPDWHTLVLDHPDLAAATAYTRFVVERIIRNPAIGRALPRLAEAAGLTVRRVVPVTATFTDPGAADQVLGLHRVAHRAAAAGYLADADAFLEPLATTPFFAAATLFVVSTSKD